MALIKLAETGFYRIPLTVALSDSTHGEIKAFELLTCRVRDSDGAEGVGYTYTAAIGRKSGSDSDIAKLTRFDPLQTTGFRSAATRRPRPRRSSISPNGQNQAVKETPEQIVAQLNGRGTGRRIGRANECANEEDGAPREVTARRLLLRAAFKQSIADLLRYEALGPLPCLVIVTAELEVLSEHDALGCCIDGSNPHNLHQRA
jgi:hypothetical protein